jgi:hypothetical protein
MIATLRLFALSLVVLAACAGDGGGAPSPTPDGNGGGGDGDTADRYFPLVIGARWSYQVIDGETGATSVKSQSVEELEDLEGDKAGVLAFRLRSEKNRGYTVSWQEDTGSAIVRHRELSYDVGDVLESDAIYTPGKLRLDEATDRLVAGATYVEQYRKTVTDASTGLTTTMDRQEEWVVEAVDEVVEVPAGRFECLRIWRSRDESGSEKRYWFALGVGKVKEEGAGQTELLAGYELP